MNPHHLSAQVLKKANEEIKGGHTLSPQPVVVMSVHEESKRSLRTAGPIVPPRDFNSVIVPESTAKVHRN